MTNQSSDIQPALRPLNVSVRAGRLTKFKGRVASIAPGLSVVTTAAALLIGGVEQAAAQQGQPVESCGGTLSNNQLRCDAGTFSNGITFTTADDLTVIIDKADTIVNGSGLHVSGTGTANVTVRMTDGTVNTQATGAGNHGLSAETTTTGTGNVRAELDGATVGLDINSASDITISSDGSAGLRASVGYNAIKAEPGQNASTPEANAVMTGGKITIAGGQFAEGVSASSVSRQGRVVQNTDGTFAVESGGDVTARMEGGFVHSEAEALTTFAVRADSHQTDYVGTVTASMSGGEIYTENSNGYGLHATIRATSEGATAIAHMSGGKITTTGGGDAFAVSANIKNNTLSEELTRIAKSNMVAKITGGTIETFGDSTAVRARHIGVGNATAEINQVDGESFITTDGNQAHGLRAASDSRDSESEGVATAIVRAGTITTLDVNSAGAISQANGGRGKALTRMEGGSITTHASTSHGLEALVDNSNSTGVAKVEMTGGTVVTGENGGANSHGILAHNSGSGAADVDMSGGLATITTKGANSHGIWAQARAAAFDNGVRRDPGSAVQAKGIVNLGTLATVTANGWNSDGIRVSGNRVDADDNLDTDGLVQLGAYGFDVHVAGSVTGGAGDAAAIRTISSKAGEITIISGADVTAGSSGIAIRTETAAAGGNGVPIAGTDNGKAVIRSAGNITGNIELDAGGDELIVTGGRIDGNVYGGDGNNTLTVEGGRFIGDIHLVAGNNTLEIADGTFTGGIYGGEGDDTVTIFAAATYDGSHVLDGGVGNNDRLTVNGQTISNTTDNFLNWEYVALEESANLSLSGVGTLDTELNIDDGSTFRAFGEQNGARTRMTIARDVTNDGVAVFSVQDGVAGDVITIDGDYIGSGTSVFALDTRMDGTDTDRLHFMRNMSGDMEVSISNVGGAGAEGGPLAIDVVTVDGTSDGTFTLVGGNHVTSDGEHAMIAGAYLYRLAETDGGWALSARSEAGEVNYQPSAPVYDSYGASLLTFNAPSGLYARGSSQDFRTLAWSGQGAQASGLPLWIQMGTDQVTSAAEQSTTGSARDSSIWEMEIGADIVVSDSAAGLLVGGLMFSYGTGSTDVSSAFGDGSIDTTGLGLGLSATWYDTRRFYVDGQFTFASYSSDLSADGLGTLTEGNGGTGFAVSIEAGQQLDLGARLSVIPQAQLSLSSVGFDDFTSETAHREAVSLEEATSQQLRLGLEFEAQDPGASGVYGIVNLYHDFGSGSEVQVGSASLTSENEAWALGVGVGGRYAWSDRVDFFGEASYATGLGNAGDASTLSASAGIRAVF